MALWSSAQAVAEFQRPTTRTDKLYGVEAVIDKDLASGLLATSLDAEMFVMLTDVPNVYAAYGTEKQKSIVAANPDAMLEMDFAAGSMGPKVPAPASLSAKQVSQRHRTAV